MWVWGALVLLVAIIGYEVSGNTDDVQDSTVGGAAGKAVAGWESILTNAIAAAENVNPIHNNPLALSGTGDTGQSFGTTVALGVYSSAQAGLAAGQALIERIVSANPARTLDDFVSYWVTGKWDSSAPAGSALDNYQQSVSTAMGTDGSTTLGDISGSGDDDGASTI